MRLFLHRESILANILPELSKLPVIMEGSNFSYSFQQSLEADEVLVSFKITETDMPPAIEINGPTFSGNFSGLFTLPEGSLKYRIGNELKQASSFSELPPKGTADLYSYSAPRTMLKQFNIKVEIVYNKGEPGAEQVLNITKWYTQPVQGNWDTFTNMFLAYVR